MVDFIKIHYRDKSNFEPFVMKEGNFENVVGQIDAHTGEVDYPYRTKYGIMDYGLSKKTGYVKNSLHKFYNYIVFNQDQNFNDFTYSNLEHSINHLKRKLVDIDNTRITQLEFGLNISTDIPAEDIIRKNILMHNLKGFNHNKKFHGQGEFKQFDHALYFFKIYDKAKQYRMKFKIENQILRIELKFIKNRAFQSVGIYNINDLLEKSKLEGLFTIFMSRFDELTIIDEIQDYSIFTKEHRAKLKDYLNPRYWENLLERKQYQKRMRNKSDFERIQNRYELNQTKSKLRMQLIDKFELLMNS